MIIIRSEGPGDGPAIADVVRRAYADVPYSDQREHLMVERLRRTDAYIPALSLIADIKGRAVGHVLLTKARICNGHSAVTTLALAPLSVVPEFQWQGVGKRLVNTAHGQAAALGFETILLIGDPTYYRPFGYQPLGRYPITLPFAAPDADCMIFALKAGALDGVAGTVRYADAWLNH